MNIYVGNLYYGVDNYELEEIFKEYGTVTSANVILDRDTGRSKGFGFVEMEDDDAGHAAIEALHGAEVGGRTLKVNEARPKEDRGGGGGGRRHGGGGGYGGGNRGGGNRW